MESMTMRDGVRSKFLFGQNGRKWPVVKIFEIRGDTYMLNKIYFRVHCAGEKDRLHTALSRHLGR